MTLREKIKIPKYTLGEELTNAITHGIGAIFSIVTLILCLIRSNTTMSIISSLIYGISSIILFTISCVYHSLKTNNGKRVLRIIDHCSIYLLIAGTYTPYTLILLPQPLGLIVFIVNWCSAALGITLNAIDLNKYKVFSMILYLVMGWMVLISLKDFLAYVPKEGMILMFIGGILYTIGSVFYLIGKNKKYMHSIFHIFVLIAAILFFFSIYLYVI